MTTDAPNYDDMFEAVEQREHILNEPDMYMGSVHKTKLATWVLCKDTGKMVMRELEYVPGLFKCFDEILVNAIDARTRSEQNAAGTKAKNALVTKVAVSWDATGKLVVRNNGPGIPVQKNSKLDIWIPEMIFGRCLTSSNYKKENRITGGKNGLGAKLANIFSREFSVETVDGLSKRKFFMRWTDNMSKAEPAQITENVKVTETYTEVTYLPDFERFELPGFTDDLRDLFERRVYDAAAWLGPDVEVTLNGDKIDVGALPRYATRFLPDDAELIHEVVNDRWTVAVALSPDHAFQQVSFVNGICTIKGGKHVDAVVLQICKHMAEWIHAKKKREVKPAIIREHLAIFLRAVIECPSFDSQTKETLTTPASKFGSKCELSKKFFDELSKTELMDRILESLDSKDQKDLKKTDGKKLSSLRGIPKLEDANFAGTNKSDKCTLILTEGDSAKTFAISGLAVVGRDFYGVYPLRGKLLNVRDAPATTLGNNKELNELKQILGLKHGTVYTDRKQLRYGRVMLLTDSDVDGSHIKGLAMNLFHALWPSLWRIPGFLCTMRTPIVKAKKGRDIVRFYALPEYNQWREQTQNGKGWDIKYYKGLGTSTAEEARDYFREMEELIVEYHPDTVQDPDAKVCHHAMTLAFDKKMTDERKTWLGGYQPDLGLGTQRHVPYHEFVNKELIHFSNYDNLRSIPSMVDGLKPSQRKVLYGVLKRNLKKEIKVAQLAGYVSEQTSYHHGEQSLNDTIINMAQDFVGANNIPLLSPNGQFGCLDPDTPILLWDGSVKAAKTIVKGDVLIGDDGTPRHVLETTSGLDKMYKISMANGEEYTVNSQHMLTLQYNMNAKIIWKESSKSWTTTFWSPKDCTLKSISIRTNESSPRGHFNASIKTREEAYAEMEERLKNVVTTHIFDIKVEDYLRLPKSVRAALYCIKNSSCIHWETKPVPIDPYIFGCWLGDGNANGTGITSMDDTILQSFARFADGIGCELTHDPNSKKDDGTVRENYHFTIRKKGSSVKTSIGDVDHSPEVCIGCQTSNKKHSICSWKLEKTAVDVSFYEGEASNGMKRRDMNPWKMLLKNNNLFNNKHIPIDYVVNDRETRLQVLAGLIDTDGCYKTVEGLPYYEISQSMIYHAGILKGAEIIARSLGYHTKLSTRESKTKKGKISIMGSLRIAGYDVDKIPTRVARKQIDINSAKVREKNCYTQSFKVMDLGVGPFCGWQVNKNERFLLGNFTVTHNSRLLAGKDAASPRYIFTEMGPLTRLLFRPEDDVLLKYLDDDGTSIEPEYYVPILPTALLNGCEGIGTGFSTSIPAFHPLTLTRALRQQLAGEASLGTRLIPWYRGFTGTIQPAAPKKSRGKKDAEEDAEDEGTNSYVVRGRWQIMDKYSIEIQELPVGVWTQDYKEFLETLLGEDGASSAATTSKKRGAMIQGQVRAIENHSTESNVRFRLIFSIGVVDKLAKLDPEALDKELGLRTTISMSNMRLFDANGHICKYAQAEDVLKDFYHIRLNFYGRRHAYLLKQYERDAKIAGAKKRFLEEIIKGDLVVFRRPKAEIEADLETREYPRIQAAANLLLEDPDVEGDYQYLTGMPIHTFTEERMRDLAAQVEKLRAAYEELKAKRPEDLWIQDLDEFEEAYVPWEQKMTSRRESELKGKSAAGKEAGASSTKKAARKAK